MPAKNGKKAWIKIKSEKPEKGGSPYRLLNVEKLDWPPDDYGNIAFNIEVEASSSPPSVFQQTKAAMQGDPLDYPNSPDRDEIAPRSQSHAQQGEDGVTATRKHLMQTSNLMVLCIKAADYVALQLPEVAHTSEQFAGILGQLFKEAYSRRTTDGVNWWSYSDLMPDKPLHVNGGKHSTTAKPIQKEEENDEPPF